MNTLLSVFPAPLARLLLCGEEGLPAAWGPIIMARYDWAPTEWPTRAWNPLLGETMPEVEGGSYMANPLSVPDARRLPLAEWAPRLALVSAYLLGFRVIRFAQAVEQVTGAIVIAVYTGPWSEPCRHSWTKEGGTIGSSIKLPTLPAHLANHPPEVALLLAVWDATR